MGTPSPAPPSSFRSRANPLTVQSVFNEHIAVAKQAEEGDEDNGNHAAAHETPVLELIGEGGPAQDMRYMYDRLADKVNAIEERILAFAQLLAEHERIDSFHPVYAAAQEPVYVVGRICCDSEGRLNDKSVLLEGSMRHSGGSRVRIELKELLQYSLFPGQVVGMLGVNPSGFCFVPSKLFTAMPPPADTHPTQQPTSTPTRPLSMVVAAGPYTTRDNMLYEPLAELLDYTQRAKPNLLLLMGPFVDSEHPHVKAGTMEVTYEDVWRVQVEQRVERFCSGKVGSSTCVATVPSTRDAHHMMVFPQPPFEDSQDSSGQVANLPNPATFTCSEVVIGCSTTDILKHLAAEEISRTPTTTTTTTTTTTGGEASDRMARLAAHTISQRSYYPLYPPALGTVLDTSRHVTDIGMPVLPDILLLPSDLAPFVKALPPAAFSSTERIVASDNNTHNSREHEDGNDVRMQDDKSNHATTTTATTTITTSGHTATSHPQQQQPTSTAMLHPVLCINPGRLARATAGGTFVHCHIDTTMRVSSGSSGSSGSGSGADQQRSVAECTRVEVIRI